MKPLLIILLLAITTTAQDWKPIKEMTGEIPNHPGLTAQVYAAEIARGDGLVKVLFRVDYPEGAPVSVFRNNVPVGFDVSSINRIVLKFEFNCDTLVMKTTNESATVYQFNGKKHKSKEPPFTVGSGNMWSRYFCERGEAPTKAPTLKPK